jgi:hypothetical protein
MTMHTSPPRTIMGAITDFLASDPAPEEIAAYQMPADLQARLHDLLDRNGEDQLTPAEKEELAAFVQADDMMSLLQAKIRLRLKQEAAGDSENESQS